MTNVEKRNKMLKYAKNNKMYVLTSKVVDSPKCNIYNRGIFLPQDEYDNPSNIFLFDFLHEIGHLETNTDDMCECECEYYATVWVIKEAKKYGVKISKKRQTEFQNYIYYWRTMDIKEKRKNIPTRRELLFVWN